MFVKTFQSNTVYVFTEDIYLLIRAIIGFFVVRSESEFLLNLAVLNDSVPLAEQNMLDCTLLGLQGFWQKKREMSLFCERG